MHKTKQEIFSQDEALQKTLTYLKQHQEEIKSFFEKKDFKNLIFTGSGSSYCLCQSGEMSAQIHTEFSADAFAAGDLMLNYPHYQNLLKNSLLIAPSRSGSTSEVIKTVNQAQNDFDISVLSISASKDSDLSNIADFSLTLPWAFDESVCQTRTVTNLYLAQLFVIAILAEKQVMIEEIEKAVTEAKNYMESNKNILEKIGQKEKWKKVVVLGDSELTGIAAEAAIAFKEIPQIPSNFHHILDVRHGPMVLIDEKTLVIAALSPYGKNYQKDLITDLQDKGAAVVSVSSEVQEVYGADFNIKIPDYKNYGVRGIPFIFVPQVIAYYKAVVKGINPDEPESLDPWIEL